jgi:hypothetical protein
MPAATLSFGMGLSSLALAVTDKGLNIEVTPRSLCRSRSAEQIHHGSPTDVSSFSIITSRNSIKKHYARIYVPMSEPLILELRLCGLCA